MLPRSRQEDAEFRRWLQTHEPEWQLVVDRPHPRREDGPRDRWWVFRAKPPSREGWPVIWIYSALLRLAQHESRRDRIARAGDALDDLARALASRRTRRRERSEVEDEVAVAYDQKSDGIYPLLTNGRSLTPEQALEAHKLQPTIEKRFGQLKHVLQIAPAFLKNEGRIEAFFLVHFLALLLSAVIEGQLRQAMKRDEIDQLPLYPEERSCRRPTTEQVFRLFARFERHRLSRRRRPVQAFQRELTDLQRQILGLLGVPLSAYVGRH